MGLSLCSHLAFHFLFTFIQIFGYLSFSAALLLIVLRT
jgi:hypothetical protein